MSQLDENSEEFKNFGDNYLMPYLQKFFPLKPEAGANKISIVELIRLLASKNPEARIRAQVAREGGYNPCEENNEDVWDYSNKDETAQEAKNTVSALGEN